MGALVSLRRASLRKMERKVYAEMVSRSTSQEKEKEDQFLADFFVTVMRLLLDFEAPGGVCVVVFDLSAYSCVTMG